MRMSLWLIRRSLSRSLKSVNQLLLVFGYPVVGIIVAMLIFNSTDNPSVRIGLVNQDLDAAIAEETLRFVGDLEAVSASEMEEQEARDRVLSGDLDAAIIVPAGYSQSIRSGQAEAVRIVSIKGASATGYVKSSLERHIYNLKAIGLTAQGHEQTFEHLYRNVAESDVRFTEEWLGDRSAEHDRTHRIIGYLVVLMLFSAVNLSMQIIKDKENRTYYRLIAAPIKANSYVLANVAVNVILMFMQIAFALAVMSSLLQAAPGFSVWPLLVVLLFFALVAVCFSLMIVAFAGSSMSARGMQNLLIIPTSLLAGCFFPANVMPEGIQALSRFMPQYWLLDSVDRLQIGESLSNVALNLGILLAFALTFALIAVYRFGRNDEGGRFA
ncbi:ABC transporter permease [Paenibacillaceae bacterium WGS1546]|uniref:ABC transporter permease n=1 Tax=Cohnella sp. WGS1546 TaxID=3366810 RepID=UPI00372D5614